MAERDPIDDLSALWKQLETPEPDRLGQTPHSQESRQDPALDWVRQAWSSLEAPPLSLSAANLNERRGRAVRSAAKGRFQSHLIKVACAVAASALCLLALAPRSKPAREVLLVPEQPFESMPSLAAYTPNSLELRSGSVRLILLDDPSDYEFEDLNTSDPQAGNQNR